MILALALALALGGCDASPTGRILVELQLESATGEALDCAAFGAEELELSLYLGAEDVLPYDRLAWPCALGARSLRVEARRYARVEARLVGGGGATVRYCGAEGTAEARLSAPPLTIATGASAELRWTLAGTPGSCPAPAPAPHR